MANNPKDLLTLIEHCSEIELNTNLNILRSDLKCTDDKVSWLPLLKNYLENSGNITLNLYERMKMLVELQKIVPQILILTKDLRDAIKSTEDICPNYKFNFDIDLTGNFLTHRSFCNYCFPSAVSDKTMFHNVTPSTQIKEITSSDVNAQILQYYPTRLVNYAYSLDYCSVSTLRLHPDGLIECILCKFKCSELKNKNKMDIHLSTRIHTNKVSSEHDNLVKFHEFWQGQPLDIWKKHLQFNYDFNRLKCAACRQTVEYGHVADHLGTCLRTGRWEKPHFETPQNIVDLPCQDMPSIQFGNKSFPFLQPKENQVVCLICNVTLTEDQEKHIASKTHISMQNPKGVPASLCLYHNVWNVLPESLQSWKPHFQRGIRSMTCSLCYLSIEYNMELLLRHLSSGKHLNFVREDLGQECANTAKDVLKKYRESNNPILYKCMPVLKLDNNIFPTVQRLPKVSGGLAYICIICNETIQMNQLTVHTTSTPHMKREADRTVQISLGSYHRVFGALNKNMQLKQIHFEIGPSKLKCKICKTFVEYNPQRVIEHLETAVHPSRADIRNTLRKALQDKQITAGKATKNKKRKHKLTPEENCTKTADHFITESTNNNSDFNEMEQEPPVKKIKIEEQLEEQMPPPGYVYFSYNQADFIPLSVKTEPDD